LSATALRPQTCGTRAVSHRCSHRAIKACKPRCRYLARLSPLCEAESRSDAQLPCAASGAAAAAGFNQLGCQKPCQATRNAPRKIRTPTVQTDHKALDLARELPYPSERCGYAHLILAARRSGPGGRGVCCQCVVTGELPYQVVLVACAASSVARYGPSSSATTLSSGGHGGSTKTSDSKLSAPTGWALM